MLCEELEINPKILSLVGVYNTFGNEAKISWIDFVQIMAMFLLRKDVLDLRYKLIINFLRLKVNGLLGEVSCAQNRHAVR